MEQSISERIKKIFQIKREAIVTIGLSQIYPPHGSNFFTI